MYNQRRDFSPNQTTHKSKHFSNNSQTQYQKIQKTTKIEMTMTQTIQMVKL